MVVFILFFIFIIYIVINDYIYLGWYSNVIFGNKYFECNLLVVYYVYFFFI